MAKLAVLFIFIFALVLVQYTAAGKIKRDAPAVPTEDAQIGLEKALEQIQEFVKSALSKENLEKFSNDLQKFGATLDAEGKNIAAEVGARLDKLKASK